MTKVDIHMAILRKRGEWDEAIRSVEWDVENDGYASLHDYAESLAEELDLEFLGNPDVITVVVFNIVEDEHEG